MPEFANPVREALEAAGAALKETMLRTYRGGDQKSSLACYEASLKVERALHLPPPPPVREVPPGWQLVPILPTPKMLAKGAEGGRSIAPSPGVTVSWQQIETAWGALLRAAPEPPPVAEMDAGRV